MVRSERFELSRVTPLPPEDSASASSATTAYEIVLHHCWKKFVVRLVRLELTRPNGHYPLKVARLPFRHSRIWCLSTESNRGHKDFQSFALPTELPRHMKLATRIRFELTISAVTGRHVRPLHHRAARYFNSIPAGSFFVKRFCGRDDGLRGRLIPSRLISISQGMHFGKSFCTQKNGPPKRAALSCKGIRILRPTGRGDCSTPARCRVPHRRIRSPVLRPARGNGSVRSHPR